MEQRLLNKTAIITGAASGIGKGTAELFAEHGANLVLVDVNEQQLEETAANIRSSWPNVVHVTGDVSQGETICRTIELAKENFGGVHIVFNNAGMMPASSSILDFSEEMWERVLNVNLKSMFLMCKQVIPVMLEQGGGSIINTSSVMAVLTEPGFTAYTASKAGIVGLTKDIAVTYAEQNIRCNALCPGWVDTEMNMKLAREMGGMEYLKPVIKKQQPLGRMATVREIAYAVLFLASDESAVVTGSCLFADGACTASIG